MDGSSGGSSSRVLPTRLWDGCFLVCAGGEGAAEPQVSPSLLADGGAQNCLASFIAVLMLMVLVVSNLVAQGASL